MPAIPNSALEYFELAVWNDLVSDTGLIALFNNQQPAVFHRMGPRNDHMPYIQFSLRMRSDELNTYMKYGRMYINVFDFANMDNRAIQIADRIQCLLNDRGFQDVPGFINSMRCYTVYSMEETGTDRPEIQEIEMTFNVRYYDVKAVLEKVRRSVPNAVT